MSEMCNVCGKYKSWCDARHGAEVVRLRAALARAEAERDANEAERLRRVLALLLMLEATEAERDRLREERDGFRDTYHEQLTLRQQAEAERDAALKRESVLRDVTRRAVDGLSQGACVTCGAEPGCNIDCPGCIWVSDAERALALAAALIAAAAKAGGGGGRG